MVKPINYPATKARSIACIGLSPRQYVLRFVCISFLFMASVALLANHAQAKSLTKNTTKNTAQQTHNFAAHKIDALPENKAIAPSRALSNESAGESNNETNSESNNVSISPPTSGQTETEFALFEASNQAEANLQDHDALTMAATAQANAELATPAGKLLQKGRFEAKNHRYSTAFKIFQKAAQAGSAKANALIGKLYLDGHIWDGHIWNGRIANNLARAANDAKAHQFFSKAAEQNDSDGQTGLGNLYAQGRFVAQDDELAIKWYALAAMQDNAEAQYLLGMMYQSGRGVEANPVAAFAWFKEAALKNNPQAQAALGVSFSEAQGVERDDIESAWWFEKAAEQGSAQAQVNLGMMYIDGRGVQQNYNEAFKWFYQAAKQGNTFGLYHLGVSYAEGLGIEKNNAKAMRLLKKAADLGNEPAQNYLQQQGVL